MISLNLLIDLFQGLYLAGYPERPLFNVTFRKLAFKVSFLVLPDPLVLSCIPLVGL
jgi:hypothetical protein